MAKIQSTFGERLARTRRDAGLTQEQLGVGLAADGSDIGKAGVSSWEVGRTQPSAGQVERMCARLKCSADYLLGVRSMRKGKA